VAFSNGYDCELTRTTCPAGHSNCKVYSSWYHIAVTKDEATQAGNNGHNPVKAVKKDEERPKGFLFQSARLKMEAYGCKP